MGTGIQVSGRRTQCRQCSRSMHCLTYFGLLRPRCALGTRPPAPLVHPNGSVYLLAHTEQYGFKHGEAIIMADTWRGPYRIVSSDSDARWEGSTANAEDPFMWIDKRGNWHQLVEGNPMPGE
jgi:hypothetical protein